MTKNYTSEELLKLPRWKREAFMRDYAKRLINRTLSNIMITADNHEANSDSLSDFLFEISQIVDNF